ncbi:MAG: hypothetical protein LC722_03065 [Actinobacteria bacterium]|nr:hypothetical protein [Actinomycetota bacterium]
MSRGVDITVKYERLAAGTRGAFLLRSADGDPHQVSISAPTLHGDAAPKDGHPIPFDPLTVDLQPGRDLVVPFDVKLGDVPRGSYQLRATVSVDGFSADDSVRSELRVR